MSDPLFFPSPKAFGAWLAQHHERESELWVGYHKVHTGTPSMTWPQSVDEALCHGWIDGLRKSLGDDAYMIRFTPRKPTSAWSAVNLKRVPELIAEGRMTPAGMAAYERRTGSKKLGYTYEPRPSTFPAEHEGTMRKNRKAWAYFEAQPPGYRKLCIWYVVSAKRPETQAKRLATLIDCSARGERLPGLAPAPKK